MSITLAELRLQARQRADMEESDFVSDSELTSYINNSIAELVDILCEAYGSEYYVTEGAESAITSGESTYALPADFYELKGVDIKLDGSNWMNVARFNFNKRNRFSEFATWAFGIDGVTNVEYRIVGNNITFSPEPDRNATYRLWYVPLPTKLVADADTLDDLNSYSEYVIVDAAIKMMQKEESDVTVLFAQKQALEKRIRDKSQNRDAGQAPTISDVSDESTEYWWRGR